MLKLFYWNKDNKHIFSRTKFLTIATFCVLVIESMFDSFFAGIIFSLIFSAFVFIVGFVIHKVVNVDSSFYGDDLSENIKHFLFYWHEPADKFRLSKTKLITSVVMFTGLFSGCICGIAGQGMELSLALDMLSLIFAVPMFLIGFVIYKIISKKEAPAVSKNDYEGYHEQKHDDIFEMKLNINKSNIPEEFAIHRFKVEQLKKEFDEKELKVKKLISANFAPSQITYDKFMSVVNNCSEVFNQHYNAVFNILSFGDVDSSEVENEIYAKINILQSFIDKLDDLLNGLVINMSKSSMDDVDNALNDMEELISSIDSFKY